MALTHVSQCLFETGQKYVGLYYKDIICLLWPSLTFLNVCLKQDKSLLAYIIRTLYICYGLTHVSQCLFETGQTYVGLYYKNIIYLLWPSLTFLNICLRQDKIMLAYIIRTLYICYGPHSRFSMFV